MRTRTQAIASFFTVTMAAMLLGAVFTTQVRKPQTAEARSEPSPAVAAPAAPQPARTSLGLETFRDIARASTAGVVNINTSKMVRVPRPRDPFHSFFGDDSENPFGPEAEGSSRARVQSLGSGFVIDKDGYILTNRHVVEGAEEIQVAFADGRQLEAKVVGQDARTDVALVKVEPKQPLTVLALGDSDRLDVGEWVMAIGNPFGLGNSVTVGVVSYKGRDVSLGVRYTSVDMIQTDAAINQGNSGGPLLNTRGEVVGINTMIVTDGFSATNAGVAFSVPINVAKDILPQLRTKGKVERGWMGVMIEPVSEDMARTYGLSEGKGALVNTVQTGSPAEKAGLKPEEVILTADGKPIADSGDLSRYISSKPPGTTVKLEVVGSKGERRTVSLALAAFPEDGGERAADGRGPMSLGMRLRDLSPALAERLGLPRGTTGAAVTAVEPGEAADDARLVVGDVIVSVNGEPVESVAAFERAIGQAQASGIARLRVMNARAGNRVVVLKLK